MFACSVVVSARAPWRSRGESSFWLGASKEAAVGWAGHLRVDTPRGKITICCTDGAWSIDTGVVLVMFSTHVCGVTLFVEAAAYPILRICLRSELAKLLIIR